MAASGYIVQHFGYTTGFLVLAGVAAAGAAALSVLLAETVGKAAVQQA